VPRPVSPGRRYVAGLDGIRALAVLCVIAYHLNVPGAGGGMLGVGVFFTLSGYLITDLLLSHWERHGDLGLGRFWLRRARRLLPALFVMLGAVSLWVALFDAGQLAAVRRQVIAAALYVGNWSTIAQHGSYFTRFGAPLPLDHLWSLAIEEQFYLVWPWLLLVGIWIVRSRRRLALLTVCAAAASAWLMGHLYHPGYDPTRVYEGTDTRAFGLLLGAALAMAWTGAVPARAPRVRGRRPARARRNMTNVLDLVGLAGLAGIVVLVFTTDSFTRSLYPAGFVLLSLATVALIAAVVNPASRLGAALGWRPLRWIGVRSYGIYLWQWPIVVLATPTQSTFDWRRALPEVAATLLVASLSWRYVEEPIRHGALGRLWRQARAGAGRLGARSRALAASSAAAALVLPVLALSGTIPAASAGTASVSGSGRLTGVPPVAADAAVSRVAARTRLAVPRRSSCRSVVYIGDSTSEGETSTDYIPNPRQRLPAQLHKVGVTRTFPEISGARSIVETFEGYPNAGTVARQHVSEGFRGCWILALGTNEVDNVHDGSPIGFAERIDRMMSIIGQRPALWVSAVTLLKSGPYAERAMQRWNRALLQACSRHPTMRVFDWAAWAKPRWFIPDGIHYYSRGYVARAHRISQALAHAFPQGRPPSSSCVVR
jgi:peptidoglycan/LPS O-acetylase OafA/YrhL